MAVALLRAVVLAAALVAAAALRAAPAKVTADKPATQSDVQALHKRLELLATGLDGMLAKSGSLGETKVAPALKLFVQHLKQTLVDTSKMKDYSKAMAELRNARAGVASLTKDLVSQQAALMNEDQAQKESLLLGVLMTRTKQSIDKQLEVLSSDDFKDLPVAKALLANHTKMALYAQAAEFLDAHQHGAVKTSQAMLSDAKKEALSHIQSIADNLQKRVDTLEKYDAERTKRHNEVVKALKASEKKAKDKKDNAEAHKVELVLKREERKWKKSEAMNHHDIQAMKAAVAAVKKGDMKALTKAQDSLKASLKAMQSNTGNFLHLLQLGHRVLRRDCPFCAAQCVDKCHQAGKSYSTCLTVCADAGKGF